MGVVSTLRLSRSTLTSDFRFFVECRMGGNLSPETSSGPNLALISLDSPHQALPTQPDLGNGSSSDHSRLPTSKIVLIVEDNIINQTVLKRQLVKAGYTCEGVFRIQERL